MTSTPAEVYILGGDDDPATQAQATLRDRAHELLNDMQAKSAMLVELQLEAADRRAATARLLAFCDNRIRPYLSARDSALYAPASGATQTRLLVRALRAQHRIIEERIHDLEIAATPGHAIGAARALATMLASCQEIEHSVLLPALAVLPGIDLARLVEDLDTLLAGGELEKPGILDVREIPHGRRHPRIFGIFARLAEGESFVLINNHDPKPLRREFDATWPGEFNWEYLESGPTQWQVRISRSSVDTQ